MENIYITIGRQYGSGGREIGRKVARLWVLTTTTRRFWPWPPRRAA